MRSKVTFEVGSRVRLWRATWDRRIPAGAVGTVAEIGDDSVVVDFGAAGRCRFFLAKRLPFVAD